MPFPAAIPEVKCGVCETVQPPASLCASCGMPLRLPPGMQPVGDPPIERMADFESTALAPTAAAQSEFVPDLEVTVQPRVADVPAEFVPGFEPTETLLLDLPGVDEAVPGLERAVEDFEKSAPLPQGAANRCQYCGFVQASGRLCDNCGLVRSKLISNEPEPDTTQRRIRCPGCGSLVLLKELCSDCGAPLPHVEPE